MGTDVDVESIESSIEACRTCGTYFLSSSNLLRQLFDSASSDSEMDLIRSQLKLWEIQVAETDVYTKYICTGCIHEFQRIFKFRRTCLDTQNQLHYFQNIREENIKIKTEIIEKEEDDQNNFTFIYVDDISGDEDGETNVFFKFSHIPIKIERADEEADLPKSNTAEMNGASHQKNHLESVENVNTSTDFHGVSKTMDLYLPPIKKEKVQPLSENPDEEINRIKCNLCAYVASNENAISNHIQMYHETKDHECHICGKRFNKSTFMRFKYHLKWHKISKHVKCAQCGFYCPSKQILNEHRRAVHAKLPCEKCGKSFTAKRLKLHLIEHQMENKVSCSLCNRVFYSKLELEQHNWDAHGNESSEEEEYEEDDEEGEDGIDLNADVETETIVICAKCNETFTSTEDLAKHVHEAHVNQEDNSLNDSRYDDYRLSKDQLQINIEDETDEDSDSTSRNDLSISHTLETLFKFQCSECCQIFETVEALQKHHLLHTEKPSFGCTFCNKTFELKFSLNRHMKKHRTTHF